MQIGVETLGGYKNPSMDDDAQQKILELEQRLARAEERLAAFENMQIAPESGGGRVFMGGAVPLIRIDGLTASGSKVIR